MRFACILLIALGAGGHLAAAAQTPGDAAPASAAPIPSAPPLAPEIAAPAVTAPPAAEYSVVDRSHFDLSRPEIRSYVDQLVAHGFDRDRVTALLGAAEPQQKILDAMSRPAEKTLQWWEYRTRVLTQERIDAGVQLWHDHKELLDQ
ncbi:MAG: lytic murein transglycosylase, partial [Steroidobacterales bacterium]